MPGKMSLEEPQNLFDRVSRSILRGLSIEVVDVPLGSLPGAVQIEKGDPNGLFGIVFHKIFMWVKSVPPGTVS